MGISQNLKLICSILRCQPQNILYEMYSIFCLFTIGVMIVGYDDASDDDDDHDDGGYVDHDDGGCDDDGDEDDNNKIDAFISVN